MDNNQIVTDCCGVELPEIETPMCSNCREHCGEEEFNGSNHYPHSNEKGYVYPLKNKEITDNELSELIQSLHPRFDSNKNKEL